MPYPLDPDQEAQLMELAKQLKSGQIDEVTFLAEIQNLLADANRPQGPVVAKMGDLSK